MGDVLNKFMDRLPDNYDKNPDSNVNKLMQLATSAIQENEDTLNRIGAWQDIDQAEGKVLDIKGQNVRQNRGQAADEIYRVLIKSKIIRNLSNGSINDVIEFLSIILQTPKTSIKVTPLWSQGQPATIHVDVPGGSVNATGLSFNQFGRLVNTVVVAGVKAEVLSEGTFAFSTDYFNSQFDTATGAADGNGNGGTLGFIYDPVNDIDLPI